MAAEQLKWVGQFIKGTDRRDEDFGARLTHLASDLTLCEREQNTEALRELRATLDQLSPDKVEPGDVDKLHLVEAELCLVLPEELLRPTWWRLRERLYRLETGQRAAWETEMTRLLPEGEDSLPENFERIVRHRLRRLVFDVYRASTEYTRLSQDRAGVIRTLTFWGTGIVAIATALSGTSYWWGISRLDARDDLPGLPLLASVSFAGIIGGAISALRALTQERPRDKLVAVLKWQLILRSLVAGVSAGFVYLAASSGFVSFNVPKGGLPAFYLALGFVSGFSERLFAQAVSVFMVKQGGDDRKSTKRKKDDNA